VWHKCIRSTTKYDKVLPQLTKSVRVLLPKTVSKSSSKMIAALQAAELLTRNPAEVVVPHWHDVEVEEHQVDLDALYGVWQAQLDHTEQMFREHVYDNQDATQYDYRQHRMFLYNMLWLGETLAITLIRLGKLGILGTEEYFQRADAKLAELRQTLHSWHGSIEHQSDLPESLKQAFAELDRGETLPFDDMPEASAQ
jgi:hypothetical protein